MGKVDRVELLLGRLGVLRLRRRGPRIGLGLSGGLAVLAGLGRRLLRELALTCPLVARLSGRVGGTGPRLRWEERGLLLPRRQAACRCGVLAGR
jgi:hypothetical protein